MDRLGTPDNSAVLLGLVALAAFGGLCIGGCALLVAGRKRGRLPHHHTTQQNRIQSMTSKTKPKTR